MRKYTVQSESQAVLTDPNREREKVDAVCDSIVNNVPYSSKFVNNELALKKKKKKKIKRGKANAKINPFRSEFLLPNEGNILLYIIFKSEKK